MDRGGNRALVLLTLLCSKRKYKTPRDIIRKIPNIAMGDIFCIPPPLPGKYWKWQILLHHERVRLLIGLSDFNVKDGSSKFDTFSIFPTMLYNCSCSIGVRTTSHTLFTSRISATSNVNLLPKSPFTLVCNWFWLQTFLRYHSIGWMVYHYTIKLPLRFIHLSTLTSSAAIVVVSCWVGWS